MQDAPAPPSVAFEEAEDNAANVSSNPFLGDVIAERLSRRDLMSGMLAVSVTTAAVGPIAIAASDHAHAAPSSSSAFNFLELPVSADTTHHVAEGYQADVLIRWGDKVLADAPEFVPATLTADAQSKQFGYNNDFVGFIPIDGRSDHGLLVVNHEYSNPELMFPALSGFRRNSRDLLDAVTEEMVAVEMMAHGGSVLEVKRANGTWQVVADSYYARRITAHTEMEISGPARGHVLMKTSADPSGTRVLGMLNNCAGGVTPWGTWLTCEENFNGYFLGKTAADAPTPEGQALRRYGVPAGWYAWGRYHDRFDVTKEANEANRFGWVVEIDPLDPNSTPKKRTAMGRFKHEGAGNIVNGDGRFVVYQGDDQRFDYVYRFVTDGKVDADNRAANFDLLDRGTLSVARFNADGTGEWLPLVHGLPNKDGRVWLSDEFGFKDQAEVLIKTRLAADMLGATKMDRPEDIEANPESGKVYLMLTNNSKRQPDQIDAANPRAENRFGHIIEITPTNGDHTSDTFSWEILVKCGDPAVADVGATFNPATSAHGWFANPDNCAVDADGRLWVATDGNKGHKTGRSDGVWAIETERSLRGTATCFFQAPNTAELCGPYFTPDLETFFVAVQHPGEGSTPHHGASTYSNPVTRWPDFQEGMPPRPAIVAITKNGGGKIGV